MKDTLHAITGWATSDAKQYVSTVRLGDKWADVDGQSLLLCHCHAANEHEIVGVANVIGRWSGAYKDVPPELLEIEHDEDARTLPGLDAALHRAYGYWLGPTDLVTVLMLKVDGEAEGE